MTGTQVMPLIRGLQLPPLLSAASDSESYGQRAQAQQHQRRIRRFWNWRDGRAEDAEVRPVVTNARSDLMTGFGWRSCTPPVA